MDRVMHGCERCDGEDECTCRLPVKQAEFKREPRYVVFKIKDIHSYLSTAQIDALQAIGESIAAGRRWTKKPPFNAVVVEQDWPEFEPTWAAIEARMKTPNG